MSPSIPFVLCSYLLLRHHNLRRFYSDAPSKSDEPCRIHFLRRRHHDIWFSASSYTVHHLAENFANSEVFDGLRFYKMRTGGDDKAGNDDLVKHQLTARTTSNLVFKHVFPGR